MANLDLWEKLEPTDPRHTKAFKGRGGFEGTAINATYVIKKLTETFGPCGRGWKFVLDAEQIVDGHLLVASNQACKLHIVRGHIEYMQEGNWYSTSPQFGQTMLVSENKYGPITDEEAPKKSITDCIGKCAVLLGIGADVHLGMFDDNKYVNQRLAEELAEEAPPRPPKEQPKVPAPKPATDGAAKKAAIKFAQDAGVDLEGLTLKEQLTSWLAVNQAKVDRLKDYDMELFETVSSYIVEAKARVT